MSFFSNAQVQGWKTYGQLITNFCIEFYLTVTFVIENSIIKWHEIRLVKFAIHWQDNIGYYFLDDPVSRPSALFLIFFMNLRLAGIRRDFCRLTLQSDSMWLEYHWYVVLYPVIVILDNVIYIHTDVCLCITSSEKCYNTEETYRQTANNWELTFGVFEIYCKFAVDFESRIIWMLT